MWRYMRNFTFNFFAVIVIFEACQDTMFDDGDYCDKFRAHIDSITIS